MTTIGNTPNINRDSALFAYTEKFDGAHMDAGSIRVTEAEIEEAYRLVEPGLLSTIRKALRNIEDYHAKQLTRPPPGPRP